MLAGMNLVVALAANHDEIAFRVRPPVLTMLQVVEKTFLPARAEYPDSTGDVPVATGVPSTAHLTIIDIGRNGEGQGIPKYE